MDEPERCGNAATRILDTRIQSMFSHVADEGDYGADGEDKEGDDDVDQDTEEDEDIFDNTYRGRSRFIDDEAEEDDDQSMAA